MDPFLISGKGSFNLPLDVQVGGHEAGDLQLSRTAEGQLLGPAEQAGEDAWPPGADAPLLSNQPRPTLPVSWLPLR